MAVTLGFAMRIDSYPPAVAVPPLIQSVPLHGPVIDVQPVSRSFGTAGGNPGLRNDLRGNLPYQNAAREQPLTYTRRGQNASPTLAASGRIINIFA